MKYEDLVNIDIAPYVIDDISKGKARAEGDKIVYNYKQYNPDIPWIFHEQAKDRECSRWHKIYFRKFGILPRKCLGCWKIVARPKNLRQLFELNELHHEMKLPGKVGVDLRPEATFKGIYLGFWYCPMNNLEGAQELYKKVKRKVRRRLTLDVPVILKRGCTEFENTFGPSNGWAIDPRQHLLEDLLDATIEVNDLNTIQPGWIKTHVMRFWIEYAHRRGDVTAKFYVKNFPQSLGAVPTVTYHDLVPEIRQLEVPENAQQEV